jgi:DNA-binding CsgD family transcriptional regulator
VFAIGNNSNNEFLIAVSLASIGKVEELEGNYLKAIEHLDSFESLSRRRYIYRNLLQVYDCKRRIYSKMGLADMEKKYDNLYQSMGLQLESNKTAGRDKSVSLLVKEQEWIMSQERKKSLYVSVGSMVVILLLLTVIIVWMKYYRRQKERIEAQQKVIEKERKDAESSKALTVEVQQKLDEVNLSFQEMSLQNQELAQRIYIDLEDLLEMARKNSPHFWKKFQERYPHFLPKMLEVDPHFRPSELVLCAYIYLGFSSKEYATYTFKSYKTVETYRYNIRKRLQLNSNIDLKIWLQSFIESNYELKSLMCK